MHGQCREQASFLSPTQPNRPIARQLDRAKDPDSPVPFPHIHMSSVAAPAAPWLLALTRPR